MDHRLPGSLKALALALTLVVGGLTPEATALAQVPSRAEQIAEMGRLMEAGEGEAAAQALDRLVGSTVALPVDADVLADVYMQSGDKAGVERALKRAAELADQAADETPFNTHLRLGLFLWEDGRHDEALAPLERSVRHSSFARSERFLAGEQISEQWADGYPRFVAIAEALEASGRNDAAGGFRRVAATGVTKAGLWAVRSGENDKALSYFAKGDEIWPIERLPVAVRMTVLRDMVVAGYRTGQFPLSLEAARQLLDLCHPDGAEWTCPAEGVASEPFGHGVSFANHPLADMHLKLLSKMTERLFVSVSWEPVTLIRRPGATSDEFLGGKVESGALGDCLATGGTSYASATGWEEDRVEFERCWLLSDAKERIAVKARALAASGDYRLIVKLMLVEMQFSIRFGFIGRFEALDRATVADLPLAEIQDGLAKGDDKVTEQAFLIGLEVLEVLKDGERWGFEAQVQAPST